MSRLQGFVIGVVAAVCGVNICYAATKLLTETGYGFSSSTGGVVGATATSLSTPTATATSNSSSSSTTSDGETCSYDACPAAYLNQSIVCNYQNAADGRSCTIKYCCDGNTTVTVSECPSALAYKVSSLDDIGNARTMEYCEGYRSGNYGFWFYKDTLTCEARGVFDLPFVNSLQTSGSCGTSASRASSKNCDLYTSDLNITTTEEDDQRMTVTYCRMETEEGVYWCPDNSLPYQQSCSSGATSVACKAPCGSLMCAGFTCDFSNIPTCKDLTAEKQAEGWFVSNPISTENISNGFLYQCVNGSSVSYIGTYCQNYFEKDDCVNTEVNGVIGDSCTYRVSASSTKAVYKCSCGDKRTLAQFCAAEHPNDADCTKNYYGATERCTLDKDENGKNLIKYSSFKSDIPLCDSFKTQKWSKRPVKETTSSSSGSSSSSSSSSSATVQYDDCPEFENEDAPIARECRVLDADGDSTIIQACFYCTDYMTTNIDTAKSTCGNADPIICHYSATDLAYMGCSCNTDVYKTVGDWCADDKYNADENCLSDARSSGERCVDTSQPDQILYSAIACDTTYWSQDAWCDMADPDEIDGSDCKRDYVGVGTPCKLDATDMSDSSQWKYRSYSLMCPTTTNRTIASTANGCVVSGESTAYYKTCLSYNSTTLKYETKYMCQCPPTYGTDCSDSSSLIRGGQSCSFDIDSNGQKQAKYASCWIACGGDFASKYASETFGCDDIDSYVSSVRGGVNSPQLCVIAASHSEQYICACPANFRTLDTWCAENYLKEGLSSVDECTSSYMGRGTVCKRDVSTDISGNPTAVLTKYAYYARYCPTNRSLFYSEDDCQYVGGDYAFTCVDSSLKDRVVCSCPTTWHSTDSATSGCTTTQIGSYTFKTESSGDVCYLDGDRSPKYQDCIPQCSDMLSQLAKPNAYVYLSSATSEPTDENCQDTLGKGAVLGYGNQDRCSFNHEEMYPCYCPSSMVECSTENGELPAEGAKTCEANGKVYYSACQIVSCPSESSTVAIVTEQTSGNIAQEVAAFYGPGATFVQCQQGSSIKYKVTCSSADYAETCDYPLTAPKNASWCRYGSTDDILMKNGSVHYATDSCRVRSTLAECGKTVVDDTNTSYTIFVASTEAECRAKYGPGISAQLCEYGEDKGSKRAYNCYYDPAEFKFTTANCGVRHDLSGDYITIDGKKYWRDCKCASAYKYHKYNCGGMMSGNACQQELTQSIIAADSSLSDAVEDGVTLLGKKLAYYPYCQCSADYTEVCDEDGSGRYKGVGTACNGKYKSCECIPDALPDNWTDNYYGCPGGKKPTGIWKDNGCGKKYYQCDVIACTWEYTESCVAPSIPVGSSCQDNEGNNGGYKACTCPAGYKICPENQSGEGEPCIVSGVSYYTSCKETESCDYVAKELCTDPLQIGVNPCTKDNMTYYEYCTCSQGYTVACKEGEVGVGAACVLDGVKYYQECSKPQTNACTDAHVSACDTNQLSYSPCTEKDENGVEQVKYLCKCPNNWFTSTTCASGTLGGEHCTQKTPGADDVDYYSECASDSACTPYQETSYSICNDSQKGEGGSCLSTLDDETTVTKYAQCTNSRNCYETGFKYNCSGYDESALGESCIDENGNKLYRSCPCPTTYVECGGNNTVKGTKCVPVNEDGSSGTPVYSGCNCDTSKYKYTCAAETSGNQGIIPPTNGSYCELAETVTTTDDDGNTVTTTENVKYYSYCECANAYKYTCGDGESGEKIPDNYDLDYCQINNTKFYKGCDCATTYTVTAAECAANTGQTTSGDGCTVRGVVERSTTDSSGTTTTTTITPDTYYQGCTCKANYRLDCDYDVNANLYDQSSIAACEIGTDHPLYPKCQCKTSSQKACVSDGKNTGITTGEDCIQKTVDEVGNITTETYPASCVCKAAFGIEESVCDDEMYDQSDEEYCLTGEKDSNGDAEPKYYKGCVCDSSIYDTGAVSKTNNAETYCSSLNEKVNSTIDAQQFCSQKTWNATSQSIVVTYRPNKSLCCDAAVDSSWIAYSTTATYSNLDDFKSKEMTSASTKFKSVCGHAYNAQVQIDCDGKAYYQCDNTTIQQGAASGLTYAVKGVCAQSNSKWIDSGQACISSKAWLGALCLYSECACDPLKYSEDTCVDQKKWENLWSKLTTTSYSSLDRVYGPVCFNFAQKATETKPSTGTSGTAGAGETGAETGETDDTTSASAEEDIQPGGWISANSTACQLTGQETCNDPSGVVEYKCDKCRCNTSIYSVIVYNDGYLENCKQDSSRTADDIGKSCFYEYCIDADGIHRKPESNIGGNGSTPLQLTQNVSCEVKSTSDQWIKCAEDEVKTDDATSGS